MGKQKYSNWAQEVQYDEFNQVVDHLEKTDFLKGAYEVITRFTQKEQKRNKNTKKRRQCWQ